MEGAGKWGKPLSRKLRAVGAVGAPTALPAGGGGTGVTGQVRGTTQLGARG